MAPPPPRLVLLRVHQREADLDSRERLSAAALSARGLDLIPLLTCHRVECYAAVPADADPAAWIVGRLTAEADGALVECDEAAAAHLMRVACGLDSAIRGEGQILTQVRRAYDEAREGGSLDPLLAELFQSALHLARELRATTPLGEVRRSVGSLAVDAAVALAPHAGATALVIGAGEVGKLASRALAARVGRLIIANRDVERAREAARAMGASVVALTEIDAALDEADVVISAADTRGAVLTSERLARRVAARPLAVIDVAVPRSVLEPDRSLPGLTYRSVDDLAEAAGGVLPEALALEAEERCAAEAARFMRARAARSAAGTIEALRERAERVRASQLARALAKLGHLSERDRRVVESLSSGLVNALLHEPTVALKEAPERAATARELFGIDVSDERLRREERTQPALSVSPRRSREIEQA